MIFFVTTVWYGSGGGEASCLQDLLLYNVFKDFFTLGVSVDFVVGFLHFLRTLCNMDALF